MLPIQQHLVVSGNRGTPIKTTKYYSPYYRDPKMVPLILGNPHHNNKLLKANLEASRTPQEEDLEFESGCCSLQQAWNRRILGCNMQSLMRLYFRTVPTLSYESWEHAKPSLPIAAQFLLGGNEASDGFCGDFAAGPAPRTSDWAKSTSTLTRKIYKITQPQ